MRWERTSPRLRVVHAYITNTIYTRMHQIFRCIYTRYTGTLYIARKSLVVLLLALKMVEYS